MFCNAENVYLLLSGEKFPEICSEFKYIAKCLKGHKTRKSWCFWRGPTRVLSANFGNTRKHIAGPEIEKCGSQAIG